MNWGEVAQHRLSEIAACSLEGDGVTRFPFTNEHRQAVVHIRRWMHKAGLDPKLDAAATLVGHRSGTGPMVLMGSHQDTVRAAGKYDGIMGILIACLALEKIWHEGRTLPYPVQVLAFADEEGVRFPTALLGPRALAGTYDPEILRMADKEGTLLGQALDAFGGDGAALPSLARVPQDVRAYLEVHIEQGPVLERLDLPVGVVTGICGIERSTVTFTGETGHAGTVPMQGRADALVAAADFIRLVHDEAMGHQDLRATVGTCSVAPNVANGIPDLAQLTLEIRAPSDPAREAFSAQMLARAAECANQRGVTHHATQTYLQPAVACAPSILDILNRAVAEAGVKPVTLPSGATHDASAMADLCEIGMLFVRCRGGVSHRPEEFASSADMGVAVEVLAHALLSLDQ